MMSTPDLSPDAAFVRRVAHLHRARDLGVFHRWEYPAVDPRVVAVTEGASQEDYLLYAVIAQAFTIWHGGRADVHYGKEGTGLGRAMRQLGRAGSYGPRDPGAERVLDVLMRAQTPAQIAAALRGTATALKSVDHPPHWQTLIVDLREWHDPRTRDEVRLRWAQQFHTRTLAAT